MGSQLVTAAAAADGVVSSHRKSVANHRSVAALQSITLNGRVTAPEGELSDVDKEYMYTRRHELPSPSQSIKRRKFEDFRALQGPPNQITPCRRQL